MPCKLFDVSPKLEQGSGDTCVEPHEVYKGRNEANRSNASHDGYVPKGILVKFEAGWFGKEH